LAPGPVLALVLVWKPCQAVTLAKALLQAVLLALLVDL